MGTGEQQESGQVTFADVVAREEGAEREQAIEGLVAGMTLKEKIAQMSGNTGWPKLAVMAVHYGLWTFDSGKNKRLGIPALRFTDGPRGVCLDHSTCFPVGMARGATWDPVLQELVGSAIGIEARAQGANFYGGVCINLLRHPGWGRAQETLGEDPYHLGVMGVAAVRGAQKHLMACAKHFACNSIEESRFFVDVHIDERTLREVYLPHFRKCVEGGVASIMSAYNKVNGTYCGHNAELLRKILKEEWGFDGLVMSDFIWGVRDGTAAANGGLDMEMPKKWRFGRGLKKAVRRGEVPERVLDEAVTRIIRQKARFAGVGDSTRYEKKEVAATAHTELALEVARKGMVLLKNEAGALPLARGSVRNIAVVGELAARPNIGDRGSSRVSPLHVVTPLVGIRDAAGPVEVAYDNARDRESARRLASQAEAVIVVAGLTYKEEGEYISGAWPFGGDREDLDLPGNQAELIRTVAAETDRCVVVLEAGSAVTIGSWKDEVEAILMAWYPGMEGGRAIAEVLFGDINPGGKLPLTWPASTDQLPFFDKKAKSIEYGYYHGYRHFDREGLVPEFPFGFGLSYTTFRYADLVLGNKEIGRGGTVTVSANVTNTGEVYGEEIAQVYVGCRGSAVDRPAKELKGFARVELEPRETGMLSIDINAEELAYWSVEKAAWVVEEAEYVVMVGSSSADADLPLRGAFKVSGP
jgi:beta-glucosidase